MERTIPDVIRYPADSVSVMVQVYESCCNSVQDPGFTSPTTFYHDDVVSEVGFDQGGDDGLVDC